MEARTLTGGAEREGVSLAFKLWLTALILAGMGLLAYQAYHDLRRTRLVTGGRGAPGFTAERYGGGTLSLSDLRGKVVLLDFWATWCPPCVQEMPELFKLSGEYADKGVVLVAANRIATDSKAAVGVFLAQSGLRPSDNARVVFAGEELLDAYRIEALPTVYVIDRQGNILDAHQGLASERELRGFIEAALAR
jgi:thiol-disulfide isomerase/thioredoxin